MCYLYIISFFFFNDTATTEIYTLSLHDALPICALRHVLARDAVDLPALLPDRARAPVDGALLEEDHPRAQAAHAYLRSEEHTSELQSRQYLVCRLLLEKKKKKIYKSK